MPDRKRKGRPQGKPVVSIIGAGRLGASVAVALAENGYAIRALVARRLEKARRAAALLDGEVLPLAAKEIHSLPPSDLYLITVPDDQIATVAGELANRHFVTKPTALHTSGALSSDVLSPLRSRGWSTGSAHPLLSVSDSHAPVSGAFWCVEGDKQAVRVAKTMVRDLGGTSFSVRSADKPLYHAAAVMASGNVVALFDVALEMLVQSGLTRKTAHRILLPLVASAVHNLKTKDSAQALTGTFARGDVETVKRHLEALKSKQLTDASALYRLLGQRSLKLARRNDPQIAQMLKSR